jgi:hypothetical protein
LRGHEPASRIRALGPDVPPESAPQPSRSPAAGCGAAAPLGDGDAAAPLIGRRVLVASLLAAPSLGRAQSFPERPVRFVVPYTAGGGTDITARKVAEGVTDTHLRLEGVRGDDWFFGVSAIAADGAESPVASAVPGGAYVPEAAAKP